MISACLSVVQSGLTVVFYRSVMISACLSVVLPGLSMVVTCLRMILTCLSMVVLRACMVFSGLTVVVLRAGMVFSGSIVIIDGPGVVLPSLRVVLPSLRVILRCLSMIVPGSCMVFLGTGMVSVGKLLNCGGSLGRQPRSIKRCLDRSGEDAAVDIRDVDMHVGGVGGDGSAVHESLFGSGHELEGPLVIGAALALVVADDNQTLIAEILRQVGRVGADKDGIILAVDNACAAP